jgi:hypothetical protein
MSKFETRKKLLIAESEVYRQLLKMEIQTFKVYGARTKKRFRVLSTYLPALMSGLPIVTSLFGRKKSSRLSLKRLSSWFFLGWKAYRQFAPWLARRKFVPGSDSKTAAEEYLAKRL